MGKWGKVALSLAIAGLIVVGYVGWKAVASYPTSNVMAQLASMPPVPSLDEVPSGPEGESIKRGHEYFVNTAAALPEYVGNKLSCASCHADGGAGPSLNLVGIQNVFPQYNSRSGTDIVLEDRIQQCFERSMNGIAPDKDSQVMKDMVAYLEFISKNVPKDMKKRPWVPKLALSGPLPTPNLANGEKLYQQACAACHGVNGEGSGFGPTQGPALWGDDSFNVGAGMARIRTAAGFIQKYMPKIAMGTKAPGTLTTQEAVDLAAYILSHPRPDKPQPGAKTVNGAPTWEVDWPKAEQPDDVAYITQAMREKGLDKGPLPWYTAYAERMIQAAKAKEAEQKAAETR
ncbi:c-type cytochrome [Hydrogenibacillus sp. N12]|uniref:c-type cytochrome n=1 Tax=Hydrogenibacillus sp. N12 TaxID=2866627 RepID=UPI001C7D1F94|nr:c-type cytochrome [Hydrogenibacillus sp. N12]QZA32277.1 c-type cytochrome [Hydrogenibacillus sp. N12]